MKIELNKIKSMTKVILLLPLAALMMGNKSCQQTNSTPEVKKRELKKIVEVGNIYSPMIDLPDGQKFDFQYVVNQQIYPVLQKSDGFWFRHEPLFKESLVPTVNSQNIELQNMNLTQKDERIIQEMLSASSPTGPSVVFSDDISCFVNLPQARISGSVNSFELKNKMGLSLGFTGSGSMGAIGLPGISFMVQTFQLDMNMYATPPLTTTSLASTNVTAQQTKTQVDFNLPFSQLIVAPSFYFQTPLARVSYNALEKAVNDIQSQLKDKEWHTRVLMEHDKWITILAGKNHNIQVGDTFDIYNERAYWKNEDGGAAVPCQSQLIDTISGQAIATIQIDDVGDDIAKGVVVWQTGEQRKMGAKVKIKKLVETNPTVDSGAKVVNK